MNQFFNPHIEMSVIGALMLPNANLFETVTHLNEDDFYDPRTRLIFGSILRLRAKGQFHTDEDVIEELSHKVDSIGGENVVRSMHSFWPAKSRMLSWASTIKAHSNARKLLETMTEAMEVAMTEGDVSEKLGKIQTMLAPIAQTQIKRVPRNIYEIALARTDYYDAVENGQIKPGWPVGIPSLDHALSGGFRPGKFYLLGARPGIGKSSFSAQLLISLAQNGYPGLMFSQEMPAEEVADRAVAAGGVDYSAIQSGKLTREGWSAVVERIEALKGLPIWIDDQPALTLADIRNKISLCPGVKVVVLDYLQLCSKSTGTSAANRNSEIEEISRGLKNLSKELDIAVIVLSQLNREVEKRVNKRPFLSDLRDSGSLEQDADVVFFLWPVKDMESGQKIVGLGIDKNRQGSKAEIALHFNGAHQQWHESTESLNQPATQTKPAQRGYDGR